ncbi:hypothetical protein [Massilia phyllosphaerae]|uniref:hypothetical protein n=1 Tax=Massilia phyllosphaerae TaxID=3106034 RepID=UPI002B1CDE4D|nr:hypothetical protein [Massilia sp. SGZ-792]
MTIGSSTELRNARLAARASTVGSAGKLRIYNGARPATGGAATTLLAEFTLGSPFAPAPSNAVQSPTLPAAVNASASGTATWFRITKSDGTFVEDGDVGQEMTLNTTTITAGLQVQVTSWSITGGNP